MATSPVTVELDESQRLALDEIIAIDKRGEFVAKIYLQNKYGEEISFDCEKINGADISVVIDNVHTAFEVKATKDENIALSKLKVSSKARYDLIVGGITVLRVLQADKANPKISELVHGADFKLKSEERWRAEKP